MSTPPSFVSAITYFDLSSLTFDEFKRELSCLHATMQKQASGDMTGVVNLFEDQIWWYHIEKTGSSLPGDTQQSDNLWICLEDPAVYETLVQDICNIYHDGNKVVEITNNLELIATNGFVPSIHYPTQTISTSYNPITQATEASIPIFPVLFTIKQAPNVQLPSMLSIQKEPLIRGSHNTQETNSLPSLSSQTSYSPGSMPIKELSVRLRQPNFIIQREPNDIVRRYSIPFDVLVVGLDGGEWRHRRSLQRRKSMPSPLEE